MSDQLQQTDRAFVPALRFKWATGLYDGLMQYFTRNNKLRQLSLEAVAPQAGEAILDFGCGTGSLTVVLANTVKKLRVSGYDIDPEVLSVAARKAAEKPLPNSPEFHQVDVTDPATLPKGAEGSYNVVVSSLVFHHLSRRQKAQALKVINDVLATGGRFILIDWGPGANVFLKAAFWLVRVFDGMSVTRDNINGKLPHMIEDAGFDISRSKPVLNTMFGTIWCYEAVKWQQSDDCRL